MFTKVGTIGNRGIRKWQKTIALIASRFVSFRPLMLSLFLKFPALFQVPDQDIDQQ